MKLITKKGTLLEKDFDPEIFEFDLEEVQTFNHTVFIPLYYDLTPHNSYQDLYKYVSDLEGRSSNFCYGVEEFFVVFFVSFNEMGILNFDDIFCYAFRVYPDKSRVNGFNEYIKKFPQAKIKVELNPEELLSFASMFIPKIVKEC